MRILIVVPGFGIDGANVIAFSLIENLLRNSNKISIFALNPKEGPLRAKYLDLGTTTIFSIEPDHFDLAIVNTIYSASIVINIGSKIKTIWMIHEGESGLKILLKNYWLGEAFKFASAVIYQSNFQQLVFMSFAYSVNPSKFFIIRNEIELPFPRAEVSSFYKKNDIFRIVQVGNVEPRNGSTDLIHAIAESEGKLECILCGKMLGLDRVTGKIFRENKDKFQSFESLTLDETLIWMQSADCIFLPLGPEVQPAFALFAALLERSILLPPLPAFKDVFLDGRNCLVYVPGKRNSLREKIQIYVDSEQTRIQFGRAAKEAVRTTSKAQNYFSKFEKVLSYVSEINTPKK